MITLGTWLGTRVANHACLPSPENEPSPWGSFVALRSATVAGEPADGIVEAENKY